MGPKTTGTPSLKMPPFSLAMARMLSPKNRWWSMPMLVTTQTSARGITLVESKRPPMPVSNTTTSHWAARKWSKANPKVNSKKDGEPHAPSAACQRWTKAVTASSSMQAPLTRMRSRKSIKCGDVKRPTLWPWVCRAAATIWQTVPLPLVPATCTNRRSFSGRPNAAQTRLVADKSAL